jgi:hypothetical protein
MQHTQDSKAIEGSVRRMSAFPNLIFRIRNGRLGRTVLAFAFCVALIHSAEAQISPQDYQVEEYRTGLFGSSATFQPFPTFSVYTEPSTSVLITGLYIPPPPPQYGFTQITSFNFSDINLNTGAAGTFEASFGDFIGYVGNVGDITVPAIVFYSTSNLEITGYTGVTVADFGAVPETSNWMVGVALLGLIGFEWLRRKQKPSLA